MKKNCSIWVFFALLIFLTGTVSAQSFKEGIWEFTVTMEIPGMPMKMPPQTFRHCVTKKDMAPQKAEPGQECKMLSYGVKGDTVTWVMECKTKEGTVRSEGRGTYQGDNYDGWVKMKQADLSFTQKVKGKWVGPCK